MSDEQQKDSAVFYLDRAIKTLDEALALAQGKVANVPAYLARRLVITCDAEDRAGWVPDELREVLAAPAPEADPCIYPACQTNGCREACKPEPTQALAANVPAGYKLVPVEPTPEMLHCAEMWDDGFPGAWSRALAAAPERCQCGYLMPCSKTVPVGFCRSHVKEKP